MSAMLEELQSSITLDGTPQVGQVQTDAEPLAVHADGVIDTLQFCPSDLNELLGLRANQPPHGIRMHYPSYFHSTLRRNEALVCLIFAVLP